MSDFLFSEFDEVSAKQWKQKIQMDLKGADYHSSVLTLTNEGITIKPFYHQDEVKPLPAFTTGIKAKICQDFFVSNEKTVNHLALDALNRGAETILFEANEPFNIDVLLKSLPGELHFKLNFNNAEFIENLLSKTNDRTIFIACDPIGNLVKSGNWHNDFNMDFDELFSFLSKAGKNQHVLAIDVDLYQNAGANAVQQLAYALSHLNEYLNHFGTKLTGKTIKLKVAIGANYFMEIAKLRALRLLVDLVQETYEIDLNLHLFAKPSLRNKTLYDYNVNMLRTTTECMSALLGGCDTICNVSYDAIFHKKNEFGERIARNQLLILNQESYFQEATNAAEGAYYIEALTAELAEKALVIFKDIEKSGGFLKQLSEGTIQRKIKENGQKEQLQFDKGEHVLLGTNAHPNLKNRMKDEIELYPFVKFKERITKIEPIITRRLAEKMEQERLNKENNSD